MDYFDMRDGLAPLNLEALQPNPAVQHEDDGGEKAMAGDADILAPGLSPHLDFDGGRDDYQGDVENIANNVDDFLNDFLALAEGEMADDLSMSMEMFSQLGDTDAPTSTLSGGENLASGVKQDAFLSEASLSAAAPEPTATVSVLASGVENSSEASLSTMSVVPEPTVTEVHVSGVASAVGITAPGTGGEDVDVADVSALADVPVATTSTSTGDDSSLMISDPLVACSTTVSETHVAEAAAAASNDPPMFYGNVPISTGSISPPGGASTSRRAAIQRYLAKKSRRCWTKASSYKSRQRVANSRPRHKGRFVPQESNFVPIAELKRRQWMEFKERQDEAARAQQEDDSFI